MRSDVPLPAGTALTAGSPYPDVVIRRGCGPRPPQSDRPVVAQLSCPVHGVDMVQRRGGDGISIWLRSVGHVEISADGRRVDLYPDPLSDERTAAFALCGPILLFIRHRLGLPSLHAGAVVTDRGTVAFLGPQGAGKSTMAASFLRCGAALLTDDALPLTDGNDGVYGVPGPPFMKVWDETAVHTLGLAEDLPNLSADYDKKVLSVTGRYVLAPSPVRIHALYFLDRRNPSKAGTASIEIRTLGRREALLALLSQTSNRSYLLPCDDALSIPLYTRIIAQTPVRVLRYPGGFKYQEAVRDAILASLDER